jgi:hypothetical protein
MKIERTLAAVLQKIKKINHDFSVRYVRQVPIIDLMQLSPGCAK